MLLQSLQHTGSYPNGLYVYLQLKDFSKDYFELFLKGLGNFEIEDIIIIMLTYTLSLTQKRLKKITQEIESELSFYKELK